MDNTDANVKYTVVLPVGYVNDLKKMAEGKIVPSVNAAIREAVEAYIVNRKHDEYVKGMIAASQDPDFMDRLKGAMEAFKPIDDEGWD
jgi:hypothetical protein